MSNNSYNLDAEQEYFEFTLKGFVYRFRHMNSDEIEQMAKIDPTDEKKAREYLFTFITSVDKDAPDFSQATKNFIVPQWKKFREMIETEFTGK